GLVYISAWRVVAQGRRRAAATGLLGNHHRPENRHTGSFGLSSVTTTGRGQAISTAATMAAISSGDGPGRSEGDIAVLALGKLLALGAQDVEPLHQHLAGLGRVDHVVDVPALGGHERVGIALGVVV